MAMTGVPAAIASKAAHRPSYGLDPSDVVDVTTERCIPSTVVT